jgi:hypothetical protein
MLHDDYDMVPPGLLCPAPSRDPWPDGEDGTADLNVSLSEASVPVRRGPKLSHKLKIDLTHVKFNKYESDMC